MGGYGNLNRNQWFDWGNGSQSLYKMIKKTEDRSDYLLWLPTYVFQFPTLDFWLPTSGI